MKILLMNFMASKACFKEEIHAILLLNKRKNSKLIIHHMIFR
jgi:hypothetical protein